jgi:putative transposase
MSLRLMVDPLDPAFSIRRQCALLGLQRSSYYYRPASETPFNLQLMRLIDEQYLRTPYLGYPKMTVYLRRLGFEVNHKRVYRLMRTMGLQAVYPRPKTSVGHKEHKVYPYLLRGLQIDRPNHVWCADITYVPVTGGYMYLVAVMDWYSRYVLSWELSNSLDRFFCLEALERALATGRPAIFNTDQGAQFTSHDFTGRLQQSEIQISMDGRGRMMDNIFIERLWRSVKYEEIYLRQYEAVPQLLSGLAVYFKQYNEFRPHQALGYATPAEVHFGAR